jgi:hypothetical protein
MGRFEVISVDAPFEAPHDDLREILRTRHERKAPEGAGKPGIVKTPPKYWSRLQDLA